MSDIDTAMVDGLKALDPKWPIREEAEVGQVREFCGLGQNNLERLAISLVAIVFGAAVSC